MQFKFTYYNSYEIGGCHRKVLDWDALEGGK